MATVFIAADRPPAVVGAPVETVETPAALVDLDALEGNIVAAAELLRRVAPAGKAVTIRPHMKAHKTPEIAARQVALSGGLVKGVCCQKVVEAEAAVAGGVADVFVCNQVVDERKIARLAALAAGGATVSALVDAPENVAQLSAAATAAGATLTVLVEIDVGQRRCGVSHAADAVALGRAIADAPGLRLGGIQAYHGGAQHVRSVEERAEIVAGVAAHAAEVVAAFAAAGLPCEVVTGGGSGTFWMEAATGVFTEVQPGSYVFNDADYARNELDPACVPNGYVEAEAALDAAAAAAQAAAAAAAAGRRGSSSTRRPSIADDGGDRPQPRHSHGGKQSWTAPWAPSLFLLTQVMSRRVAHHVTPPFLPGGSHSPPADGALQASPAAGLFSQHHSSSGGGSSSSGASSEGFNGRPLSSAHPPLPFGAAHHAAHHHGSGHSSSGNSPKTAPLPDGWVVVDSGLKAQSTDSGPGFVVASLAEYVAAGARHKAAAATSPLSTGSNGNGGSSGDVIGVAEEGSDEHHKQHAPHHHHHRAPVHWDPHFGSFRSDLGHLTVRSISDEHSTLLPVRAPYAHGGAGGGGASPVPLDAVLPPVGTKLLILPGHCDPFVNHYDWLVGFRNGVVEAVWRVAARSPGA